MTLERIIYYPIKSLRGIEVSSLLATPIGLKWDRRWMLVEESGHFVSQRKDPQLAQLSVQITTDGWLVSHPDGHSVTVPHERQLGNGIGVEVWGDHFQAIHFPSKLDEFFSSFLGRSVRLVYHHNPTGRVVNSRYSKEGSHVGFADGFPYLVISTASIQFCQSQSPEERVDWRRFRPNLIVTADEPFIEDSWSTLRIGEGIFDLVKPCARCVMITVDPETGESGSPLLKVLSTSRRQEKGIMVGQNALLRKPVTLKIGDSVTVMSGEKS